MALVRWSPWQGLFDVQRDMDVLLRRMTGGLDWPGLGNGRTWVPAVDVFHREGDLVVRAELPGVDPEKDVDITVQDNVLTIKGERRHEERAESNGISRFETAYGSFERRILLPEGVKESDIQASFENGILEVVVPGVAELTAPKKIPVQIGSARRKAITTRGRKS
ncbi:MAG TPA: Hsp20/alpha crystallin family protein [Actinomycetota bacterium]|nr:Hsp20/alpha crystallin family protein [Actinomycetota bacterium]